MVAGEGSAKEPNDAPTRVIPGEEEPYHDDETAETVEGLGGDSQPDQASGTDHVAPLTIGRYVIERRVGAGGMGVVYLATDPQLDRPVAIKVLAGRGSTMRRAEAAERLEREARALARIRHPNVVVIHDVGRHDDAVFVVMEYVEGSDLRRWLFEPIERRGWKQVVDVFIAAGQGLAAVHATGLVHRDFKPANVLIADDQRVLITDFGLARESGPETASLSSGSMFSVELTAAGTVMGTPAFMSPELLRGEAANPISDQFAFCVSLWQGLHGKRPFHGQTIMELREAMETGPPSRPTGSRVPRWLHRALLQGLEHDPSRRFPSMDALLRVLRRGRRGWRRELLAAGALVSTTALVAVAAHREPPPPCEDAAARIAAIFGADQREALRIGGDDYTAAHAQEAREHLEQAIDDYGAHWAESYAQSCAAVGPHAQLGTPAEQATAQCLENRLGSLRGLIELATTSPLDASRVDAVVGSLPALEDCTSGRWVPYPTGPGEAERAAAIDEQISEIRRERFADRNDGLRERIEAVVLNARDLGAPYQLARALGEQSRILGKHGEHEPAFAGLEEALELALAAGHDRLAAHLANDILLVMLDAPAPSWREVRQLAALARALTARSGPDDELMGNVLMNQASLLRHMGRRAEALDYDDRAVETFARAGLQGGMAKARLNHLVSLIQLDRFDEAESSLDEVTAELEATLGKSSTEALLARRIHVASLYLDDRRHEAAERSHALYQVVHEHYAPSSTTYQDVAFQHVMILIHTGALDEAEQALAAATNVRDPNDRIRLDHQILAGMLAFVRRDDLRTATVLGAMEPLLARVGKQRDRDWYTLTAAELELITGQAERVRARYADPTTLDALSSNDLDQGTRSEAALLAVLSEAPVPPPATRWSERFDLKASERPSERLMLQAIEALESPANPTQVIERTRDELARMYCDGVPAVRMLDTWLAQQRDHSRPDSRPTSP